MAGGITALRMNLDFLFNTSNAESGFSKIKKGFQNLGDSAQVFMDAVRTAEKDFSVSFSTMKGAILDNIDANDKFAEKFTNLGNVSQVLDNMGDSLQNYYNGQLNVISGMRNMTAETAAFTSNAALVELLTDANAAAGQLAQQFDNLGIKYDQQGLAEKLLRLGAVSEKTFDIFNNVVEESIELSKGLGRKQLARYREEMGMLQEALDGGQISMQEYTKRLDRLNYKFDVMNNKLPNLGREFGNLFSGARGGFLSTLAAASIFDDALSAQQQTVETTHRLALRNIGIFQGQTVAAQDFQKTVRQMEGSVRNVGRETQISMSRAAETMNSLAAARIPGTIDDLENLSVTSVRMQQAFGIAEGQAADLFRTLSLSGNLSPDGINAVGEALADTQAVWGMTSEEATEAAAQIGRVINRMTAMGANSIKNAGIVAREVGRMTTAFTRAGLSAQDASQMMDRFMDPTKIEDNALLWHSMGMSVSDGLAMMTGDASAMEGMTEGLMRTAKNLREEYGQNPLALQAMAEAHGMTIQQVNQLANELDREANMTAEARKELERQADLESQAAQARESAAESIKRLAAIGNVLMQSFVMPLLDALMAIARPIMNVIKWIQGLTSKIAEMGPVGKGFVDVLRFMLGAVLLFTVVTRINLLKLIRPLGSVTKGFTGLWSNIKNGAATGLKAIGKFTSFVASKLGDKGLGGVVGKLGEKFSGLSSKIGGGAQGAGGTDQVSNAAGQTQNAAAGAQQKSKVGFLEKLSKVRPAQLLALAVAILAVGAAIAVIALSFSVLAKSLQELDLAQLLVLMGLAIVIMGGFAVAMYFLAPAITALGVAGAAAAPGLLALAVAMFAMGAAIAVVVLSIAVLVAALSLTDDIFPKLVGLTAGLALLIGTLALMAPVVAVAMPALYAISGALLLLGAAFVAFGLATVLVGVGLRMIVDAINSAGEAFTENAAAIASGIFLMIPAIAALGVAGLIAFFGIMAIAGALFLLATASNIIAKSMPVVNSSLERFVDTIKFMRENIKDIRSTLRELAAGLSELAVVALTIAPSFLVVGLGLMMITRAIAVGAMTIGMFNAGLSTLIPLLVTFSETAKQLSPAAQNFAQSMHLIATAMFSVASAIPSLIVSIIGFALLTPVLLLMNFALSSIANSFSRLGEGAQLFANNIGAVIEGIRNLKDELGGVKGLANDFVREVNAMNVAFQRLANTGGIGMNAVQNLSQTVSVERGEEDNGMMTRMDTVIEHLSAISGNTSRTASATEAMLERMNRTARASFNAEAEANIPG